MAYTLTGRKGGTVRFVPFQTGVVEKESESYSSSVTSNPIEAGSEINDHVNKVAIQKVPVPVLPFSAIHTSAFSLVTSITQIPSSTV